MRKVTFGGAPSLDGYFARKNDAVDWLMWSNEAAGIMNAYWKTIDTIVMGRKTYEAALKMKKGRENLYGGLKYYVFFRTLKPKKHGPLEIGFEDGAKFVARFEQEEGEGNWVKGGGEGGPSLLATSLCDGSG